MIVCLCAGIPDATIRALAERGAVSADDVTLACGAGGDCGACLEGVPNMQRLNKVNVGETVPEQLRVDLEAEQSAIRALNEGIEACRAAGDNGSRQLLEDILTSEENHVNWIEAQLAQIQQMGEA